MPSSFITSELKSRWAERVRRLMPIAITLLMLVMIATEVGGFLFTSSQQRALIELRNDTREMRIVQQALVDEQVSLEDYLLTGQAGHLQAYFVASNTLGMQREQASGRLDKLVGPKLSQPASRAIGELEVLWARSIELARSGDRAAAQRLLVSDRARELLTAVRLNIARYLEVQNARGDIYEQRIALGNRIVLALQIIGGCITLLCLLAAFRASSTEARARKQAMQAALDAHRQVKSLFEMADMLQSASGYEDANKVLSATAARLLPHLAGSLYVFSNSRDRLDLMASWNSEEGHQLPDTIAPSNCWALKRGKAHTNAWPNGFVTCEHHIGDCAALEIPMLARGEIYGLLSVTSKAADAERQLEEACSIVSALADAMSLALSNISLREKLRSQALRDPLTGLYNRRYMEDMLQRFVLLSERNAAPVSVIMIDLDHFKRLNDEHGHMMGDTVLRSVAAAITSALRESDVACRYGGEELIVLLPECGLEDALAKAEELRSRIEALSDAHGVKITASFGVACAPETSASVRDILTMSDSALYEAKREGRNRVAAAPSRAERGTETRLAAE